MTNKIILDCDPGHDDALAILLAHGCPAIELLAITTVAGNQTLDKTTRNAQAVCAAAAITGVPVAAGCDRPLLRELRTAAHVHGESGLGGVTLPEPAVPPADAHAVDLIVELVLGHPSEVTLVPIGPLTNIALALRREPRIAGQVREVVLMGGAHTRGNITPAAEFNIWVDPEAAEAVFTAGWPVTMVGLDLTHQALATPDVVKRIAALDTPAARLAEQIVRAYQDGYVSAFHLPAPPLHDPCAVARVAAPDVVDCVDAHVAIETQGRWTAGMTVTDFDCRVGPANARVATTLRREGFWGLMLDSLASASPR
ncbi:MAG: ribonucleoside hydrolase [Streptosporangiales bacterium]|nr:ribonucleoside hydrolase [Streptosporangiales bacterium]